jgi:GIY-YIG catalytic domain
VRAYGTIAHIYRPRNEPLNIVVRQKKMLIFNLLQLLVPELKPEQTKVHLASWNGRDNPLSVYLAGDFNEWQSWQNGKNFGKPFVLSLISLPERNKWLFAGIFRSLSFEKSQEMAEYRYELEEVAVASELKGRLIVHFERAGRASYLLGENWSDRLLLSEVRAEPMRVAEFPGYRAVQVSFEHLRLIVNQAIPSWKGALSSVAGVYLISDNQSEKLYVGSACGEGGIWQRWSAYAESGHGGNIELRKLLIESNKRAESFTFSILEIADIHDSKESILKRESHWKKILMSALNAN